MGVRARAAGSGRSSVVVVGAGLAGLAAAHRLAQAGADVRVAGAAEERFVELAPRAAPVLAGLAAELGLSRALARMPLERLAVLRDGGLTTREPSVRAALGRSALAPARLRRLLVLLSWLGGELDPEAPERATRLDDRSVADLCRVYLGRRAERELFAPLLATLFGLDAAETSRQLAFLLLGADARIGVDLLSGTQALAAALGASGAARVEASVDALAPDGRSVRLAGGATLDCDAVVLACGVAEARRLWQEPSPPETAALRDLRCGTAIVAELVTRLGVAPVARLVGVPEGMGGELAGVIDVTPPGELERQQLRLVARPGLFARHGHRPDDELAHFLIESAARAVPGLAGRIETLRVRRVARPSFSVGHYRALARLRASARARGLYLAGDWTIGPHVEGELASGERAARELLAGR